MKREVSKISGLILAAGFSSRMGRFKPLLPLGGSTATERAVKSLRDGGIEDVRVVVGWRTEELVPVLDQPGGLRTVLSRSDDAALDLDVADQGTVLDMDTPADHEILQRRCARMAVPSESKCEATRAWVPGWR